MYVARDVETLPIGLWVDMLQLSHMPMGRSITLPIGLLAYMWQLCQLDGHPYACNEIPLQPIMIVWILLVNKT
jgi:hypothetical protein